ncbi:MAG TPA: ABC transporter substrate-binding protein [Symbiobacteriaceae bacterium]|jgi:ABC-type transport system substrate-binding protein
MKRRFWNFVALALVLMTVFAAGCTSKPAETKKEVTAPVGKKLSFELMAYSNPRPYNPEADKLAEAIQSELAKAGIEVKITTLPWTQYKDAIRKDRKGDAYLFGWTGDNGDPDNFLFVHFHSSQSALNVGKYKNAKADELLLQAQQVSDMSKRTALYADAQKIIEEEAPWLFVSHMNNFIATRDTVQGFKIHPTLNLYDFNKIEVTGKKDLIYAQGADATSLDPAMVEDGESAKPIGLIFDNLVKFAPGSTTIEPMLAKSWDISADGKTYTFKLREGVKFQDGTPFDAEAVKFSIGRQLTDDAKKNWPYADFSFGMVKEIKVVDPLTVQIILNEPTAPFLANLAMSLAAPIVSPTAVKKYGDKDFGRNPVGTGAFSLEKWDKDQQIVLKANPNYWGGAPKLERVIFKVTAKNEVRADEIIAGSVDIMDGIAPADIARITGAKGVKMVTQSGMNISYMGFMADRPPFDNVKLRQAVSMLIDREALVKALYKGNATVAQGALPAWMPGFAKDVKPVGYDPAKAKAMLKELGYAVK